MRRFIIIAFLVVWAIFIWTALDDITTSPQEDYTLEYLTVVIGILLFTMFAYLLRKLK